MAKLKEIWQGKVPGFVWPGYKHPVKMQNWIWPQLARVGPWEDQQSLQALETTREFPEFIMHNKEAGVFTQTPSSAAPAFLWPWQT